MNEGRPYLQIWRGVWVSFYKIDIVSFLSVRYKLDDLYSDIGKVLSDSGIFRSTGELREFAGEYMGLIGL